MARASRSPNNTYLQGAQTGFRRTLVVGALRRDNTVEGDIGIAGIGRGVGRGFDKEVVGLWFRQVAGTYVGSKILQMNFSP